MSLSRRLLLFVLVAIASLGMTACRDYSHDLVVTNNTGIVIDFIYAEDFIDLRDFGRDYQALEIGDVDTYQGCTECNIQPGGTSTVHVLEARNQSVILAARDSSTKRLVYLHRFRFEELNEMEWQVGLTKMTASVK
jgi:hypothetical protein